jgi:hypothetical protein
VDLDAHGPPMPNCRPLAKTEALGPPNGFAPYSSASLTTCRTPWWHSASAHRSGTGLPPTDFLTRLRLSPRRLGSGLYLHPGAFAPRCCRLAATPPLARPGPARDCKVRGFPEFEQFCISGFPESTQIASSPLHLPVPPRPSLATGRPTDRPWCGRGDSNPHGFWPTDFKSAASTDSATSAPGVEA